MRKASGVVRIQTEELQSKQFSLIMNTYGNLAEDYAVNKAVLTPDHVTVEGPTSQVGLINHVGIELNVNGLECHHALYSGKPWIIPDIGVDHTGTGGVLRLLFNPGIHAGQIQLRYFSYGHPMPPDQSDPWRDA